MPITKITLEFILVIAVAIMVVELLTDVRQSVFGYFYRRKHCRDKEADGCSYPIDGCKCKYRDVCPMKHAWEDNDDEEA